MTNAKFDPDGKLYLRRGKEWIQAQCRRIGFTSFGIAAPCDDKCAMMRVTDAADDDWSVTLCTGAKYALSSWGDGKIDIR